MQDPINMSKEEEKKSHLLLQHFILTENRQARIKKRRMF